MCIIQTMTISAFRLVVRRSNRLVTRNSTLKPRQIIGRDASWNPKNAPKSNCQSLHHLLERIWVTENEKEEEGKEE